MNWIYEEFKREFFPGETVFVTLDGEVMEGDIREKAKFPMIRGPDGSVQRAAFARYFIRLHESPHEEALVDEKHLRRDRKIFTKLKLRAFFKNSLQREAWHGAPWLVKEPLAIQYRLPMEIPANLLQDAHVLAQKQQMMQMKHQRGRHPKNMPPPGMNPMQMQQQMHGQVCSSPESWKPCLTDHAKPGGPMPPSGHPQNVVQQPPPPPKPAMPKYPIEDLDNPPRPTVDGNGIKVRPQLKQLDNVTKDAVGGLLEIWDTLNVQCEVYVLDSFTFDDLKDALNLTGTAAERCELLNEIFCAVLKQLINDKGRPAVALPKIVVEKDDESEEGIDESTVSTPIADVPARSTRSRLSHVENVSEQPDSPTVVISHRASEALHDFDWIDALARSQMENGGWQLILVGILNQLSFAPRTKEICDKILSHLVPVDLEPTKETVKERFEAMDINLRIAALEPILLLSVTTKALKDFMETCSEDQTDVRKRKQEFQREKKIAMENLAGKDRDRKIMLPEIENAEKKAAAVRQAADAVVETNGAGSSEPEDAPREGSRSTRRSGAGDRKRKRDEEHARKDKARQEIDAADHEMAVIKKNYQALVRDCEMLRQQILELEASISDCDSDLREADVQRTRMLGKDRFCNRYYWFERNGQPFGGLPSSSTSEYGYANGRIWVQGPDDMEREGFIDRNSEEQAIYKRQFGCTLHERRTLEEGKTVLHDAREWGYYDDPEEIEQLIQWLDDRGEREKKLRKELFEWKPRIAEFMRAHKDFMDSEAARKLDTADEEPKRGIATRRQTQEEKLEASERCMRWRNSMVRDQEKRLHSENPPEKKQKAAAAAPRSSRSGAAAAPSGVLLGRSGKPLTRQ